MVFVSFGLGLIVILFTICTFIVILALSFLNRHNADKCDEHNM